MTEPTSLLDRFPPHSIVTGQVTRVAGAGVTLLLEDGINGYIPSREIAWSAVDQPRRYVREGQQIEAMVLGEDALRNHLVLSRRLVMRNPWATTITADYPVHTVRTGR